MSKTKSKALSVVLSVTTTIWLSGAVMLLPVAGAQTTADLNAQIATLMAQITALQALMGGGTGSGVAAASCGFTRSLTVGATGSDVKCLQQYLNGSGNQVSASGVGSPGQESSYFGIKTKLAVAKWQTANGVAPAAGYFGSISRAKYNALMAVAPTPTPVPGATPTPVPGTVLSLALASDNPGAQTVPLGATGVAAIKFTVSGNGSLDSLTFKRVGVGAVTDFASGGIYLYEGNSRVTTGRTLNSTTHEVSFINLNLAVSGTRTFWLGVDINTSTSGGRDSFQLSGSTGTPSTSGTLMGNEIVIGTGIAGGVTILNVDTVSNPNVGQADARVSNFRLTAGATENISVRRVVLSQGGSISNGNLSSFTLKQNGVTLATATGVSGRDLIVFDLATPFAIEKGQNRLFDVYATIGGNARANDTIRLYVDSASDIFAVGSVYGFGVAVTNTMGTGQTLTLQGGQVTVSFNGPAAGDIAVSGQNITVLDFTISAQSNIEIRKLYLVATSTPNGTATNRDFRNIKIAKAEAGGAVVTSAFDTSGATTTAQTLTDVINLNAGQSQRYIVTLNVPSTNTDGTIQVALAPFALGDIKNLDNNTNVALADIVPLGSSAILGNQMSVAAIGLESTLSGQPASRTVVAGLNSVDLVGFNFRATGGTVKINTIKVNATAVTGTNTQLRNDLQSIQLWVGTTQIGQTMNWSTASGDVTTASFSNLNYTVPAGETRTIVVRVGTLATNSTNANVYRVRILDLSTDVVAVDADGNSVSAGSASTLNSAIQITVGTGSIQIAAVSTAETQAANIMANGTRLLGKFEFYATNAAMDITKLKIGVQGVSSSTATTTLAQEVATLSIYDGDTLIASGKGNDAGRVILQAASGQKLFTVNANETKTITVKAVLNDINSTTGAVVSDIYAYVNDTDFRALSGAVSTTTLASAPVVGQQMRMYKSIPTVTATDVSGTLTTGQKKVASFTLAADSNGDIELKQFKFNVTVSNATLTADTVVVRSGGSDLTLTSGTIATTGATGTVRFANAERITAGTSKTYDVYVTVSAVGTNTASVTGQVLVGGTAYVTPTDAATIIALASDQANFVWSDRSALPHSETSLDWHTGYRVKTMPSVTSVLSKN